MSVCVFTYLILTRKVVPCYYQNSSRWRLVLILFLSPFLSLLGSIYSLRFGYLLFRPIVLRQLFDYHYYCLSKCWRKVLIINGYWVRLNYFRHSKLSTRADYADYADFRTEHYFVLRWHFGTLTVHLGKSYAVAFRLKNQTRYQRYGALSHPIAAQSN